MESPKRMAKSITGRNDSTGPVRLMPNKGSASPHWTTATKIPKAAPMESRFMAAPTSGITKLRNTIDSRMNDSTTTRAMKRGSLADSTWAKSTKMAVSPPTSTFTPLSPTAPGMVTSRR